MDTGLQTLVLLITGILIPSGILLSILIWSIKNGIVPMPTTPAQKRAIVANLPQDLRGNIYDLGSGWGTLAFSLAKSFSQCRIIGLESSPVPYGCSRFFLLILRYRNVELRRNDIYEAPLQDASAVVCYLHRAGNRQLELKLERELKPGTWVLSNTFAFPGWKPAKITEPGDSFRTKIYVYKMGEL